MYITLLMRMYIYRTRRHTHTQHSVCVYLLVLCSWTKVIGPQLTKKSLQVQMSPVRWQLPDLVSRKDADRRLFLSRVCTQLCDCSFCSGCSQFARLYEGNNSEESNTAVHEMVAIFRSVFVTILSLLLNPRVLMFQQNQTGTSKHNVPLEHRTDVCKYSYDA